MPSEEPRRDLVKLLASINVEPVRNAPPIFDPQSKVEQQDLKYERQKAELEHLKDHVKQRKKYASRTINLVYAWIIAVFGLLLLEGSAWHGFHLSESIVITALGTTTANIVGVLVIVMKYFFPSSTPESPTNPTVTEKDHSGERP